MTTALDRTDIGKQIKKRRNALKLTQEALAERVDLSLRMIADLERGIVGMSLESLITISEALKCTPNDLLSVVEAGERQSDADWLYKTFVTCPSKQQSAILDIVKAYLRWT